MINRKNKKTIALIATILPVLSIIVVLATQGLYSKAIDDATGKSDKNVTSTTSSTASSEKKDDTTKKTFKLNETLNNKTDWKLRSTMLNSHKEPNTQRRKLVLSLS